MTELLLYRSQIDARPETPSRKCRSEFVEPEIFGVQLRAFGDRFQIIEKVHLHIAFGCRKDQTAWLVGVSLPGFETLHKLCRDGNLALFICLRRLPTIRFVSDPEGSGGEVEIGPIHVHNFLLPHARH